MKIIKAPISDYADILQWQNKAFDQVLDGESDGVLWLGQHNSVITCGRSSDPKHIVASQVELNKFQTEVHHIDRGGDVTWHGPGQLVGYPIINLVHHKQDLHWYLRQLEEVVRQTLRYYSVDAKILDGKTGVWVDCGGVDRKIASIGVHVSRWITKHGFALNVCPDLQYFDLINPCGLNCQMTSLHDVTGLTPSVGDVADVLSEHFASVFSLSSQEEALCR